MKNTVFKFIIKPLVYVDVEEAVSYYDKQLQGLGRRFYNVFIASLIEIETKPFVHSYIRPPVRRYKIKKFPYKIFYIIKEDSIFVIGVSHAKRSNAFVRRRLKLPL